VLRELLVVAFYVVENLSQRLLVFDCLEDLLNEKVEDINRVVLLVLKLDLLVAERYEVMNC
jgi:hypothetical protein